MRVEIDVVLFFPDQPMKKINGFLNIGAAADEEDILNEMAEFIEIVTEGYMDDFTTGLANILIGDEEVYNISFANPRKRAGKEGREICNIVIPEEMTIH